MQKLLSFCCAMLLLSGCDNPGQQAAVQKQYFDLKGYFSQEAKRLTSLNPVVDKTVMVNKSTERKKIRIADWNGELTNFSDADINKSAWIGLFTVQKTDSSELYRSDNEKVLVKELLISKKSNQVTGLRLILNTSNYLYTSTDTLTYYPDSLYEIKKNQHISLLNKKSYHIRGAFSLPEQK